MKAIFSALAAAALLAGCGGDGSKEKQTAPAPSSGSVRKPPKPAEKPVEAAKRIAAAVRAGECPEPHDLFHAKEATAAQCREILPAIVPASPPEAKAYGTGAVVENVNGQTILALDATRRFKIATSASDLDLPTVPPKESVDALDAAVSAIRRDNCDDIVRVSMTYAQAEGETFCALEPVRRLHEALAADPDAKPVLLGGNGTVAFYGVGTRSGHYFTLVFFSAKGDLGYLFVTSLEA